MWGTRRRDAEVQELAAEVKRLRGELTKLRAELVETGKWVERLKAFAFGKCELRAVDGRQAGVIYRYGDDSRVVGAFRDNEDRARGIDWLD